MRKRLGALALGVSLAICACEPGSGGGGARAGARDAELDAYCEVARRADLELWVRDVVTLCAATGEDHHEAAACRAGRVVAGGAVEDLGGLAVRRALPASGDRLLLLLDDERLVLAARDGRVERELAPWASDPFVSEDGARAAWVGLPDGASEYELGAETVLVAADLADPASAPEIVARDPLASTPRPIPGSRDVLYVSTTTGVASAWIAGPGRAPEQLTNVGADEAGPDTAPVFDRQIAWADGALLFAIPGEDGEGAPRVHRLDLETGATLEVGPGAWPRALRDGSIAARQEAAASGTCAAVFPAGGTP